MLGQASVITCTGRQNILAAPLQVCHLSPETAAVWEYKLRYSFPESRHADHQNCLRYEIKVLVISFHLIPAACQGYHITLHFLKI